LKPSIHFVFDNLIKTYYIILVSTGLRRCGSSCSL